MDSVSPGFGPLSGGTRVVITGAGFLNGGASPNRVLFGVQESPQAGAVDDATLEVVVPAGEAAGDVPITVFNRNGNIVAMGKFKYSSEPTITTVTPANVLFSSEDTTVTVNGTGFLDENAGRPTVLVNGEAPIDVQVISDTQITFTAKPGEILAKPVIEIDNARGSAEKLSAFRYVPSLTPGLFVFPKNTTQVFAVFFNPTTMQTVTVPKKDTNTLQFGFRAIVADAAGDFTVIGRDNRVGKLDMATQLLINPETLNTPRISGLSRVGATVFAVSRSPAEFGTFNPATRVFTSIAPFAGQNPGLAHDGTTMFAFLNKQISTINTTTGARGTPVALSPANLEVSEARFIGDTLYAAAGPQGAVNQIVSINPTTGVATTLATLSGLTLSGVEVFQP
ncbi:MAG: IPT/TIG domain-containing protein [Deltaproteobacteria bacterium]|nr:IPT/TIG domain-containing protein [Deltaproteobacteria bacterium]MDQ3297282.1 IPT/TIG domain-containing protein [Myxococcota bacterium]